MTYFSGKIENQRQREELTQRGVIVEYRLWSVTTWVQI